MFLPKYLEIPSFDTTVRRRTNRSRPPQVGAAAHTCTASADRTAPAKTFRAPQSLPFSPPLVALCLHTPAPPKAKPEAESGGPGGLVPTLSGNYFPRRGPGQRPEGSGLIPSFPAFLGAAPRCSGLFPLLSLPESPGLSLFLSCLSLMGLKFKSGPPVKRVACSAL